MKKLVVGEFLSVDGVMQAPGGREEDTEGGFKHGGWQIGYVDAKMGKIIQDLIVGADALLLGRVTYQIFAAYWPHATAPEEQSLAEKLNSMAKYVASTTLDKVDWNNSTLIKKNVEDEIARLKREPGSGYLNVTGSGRLAQSLMKAGLVDELVLFVHPVFLGSGKRLFDNGVGPTNLRLVSSKTLANGVVILSYRPINA